MAKNLELFLTFEYNSKFSYFFSEATYTHVFILGRERDVIFLLLVQATRTLPSTSQELRTPPGSPMWDQDPPPVSSFTASQSALAGSWLVSGPARLKLTLRYGMWVS